MRSALIALVTALAAGLFVTPFARLLARAIGLVARPSSERWHRAPTAMLGGLAIAVATAAGFAVALVTLGPESQVAARAAVAQGRSLGVAAAAFAMLLVGLWDDRYGMRAQVKFVLQVLAGLLLIAAGAAFPVTQWYVANVLITVFWFVAITNAFNLLDNMDGVAAGVGAIAAIFLGLIDTRSGAWLHTAAAWALAGAAIGFLRYNFHPASIFMGDAGSLFIGAVLAGLLVTSPVATAGTTVGLLVIPLTLVAVPILDTALVSVTRVLVGRSISQGGRDHSTHRLAALGMGERQVALVLYGITALCGLMSLYLVRLDGGLALLWATTFLMLLALGAAYMARHSVRYSDGARGWRGAAEVLANLLYKRRLAELLLDAVLVTLAWYGAFRLRFDAALPPEYSAVFESSLALVIALKISAFALFGVYRGAWRYSSIVDAYRVLGATAVSSALLFVIGTSRYEPLAASHSIIYIDVLLTAGLLLTTRLSFRSLETLRAHLGAVGIRVAIYGAGDGGEIAVRELRNNRALGLVPVCFIDDDERKHGSHIHGVAVAGGFAQLAEAIERHGVRRILMATKKLPAERLEDLKAFVMDTDVELVELDLSFRPLAGPAQSAAAVRITPVGGSALEVRG
jgi:UDP-GlcNAc:undecaprenyl-phosphate GlcNAc-1-phosphate transferase